MATPEQDKADAELFRGVLKALTQEKNRELLMQMGRAIGAADPTLIPPLMKRGQEIAEGR